MSITRVGPLIRLPKARPGNHRAKGMVPSALVALTGAPAARERPRGRAMLPLTSAVLLLSLMGCSTGTTTAAKSANPAGPPHNGPVSSSAASVTGTPGAANQPGAPADACGLLTPAEAKAALGKPVQPARSKLVGPGGEGASCIYRSTDFANGTSAGLALVFTVFAHSSMDKSQFDKLYSGTGSTSVAGLGDGAWYSGGMLNVYAHGAFLTVTFVSLTTEATVDQLAPVARLLLQRI